MKSKFKKKIAFFIFALSAFLLTGIVFFYKNSQLFFGEKNDMLQAADVKNGAEIAKACTACHSFKFGEPNKFGPNLFGIFGAKHAHDKEFAYSEALKKMNSQIWTVDNLYKWLKNPAAYAPGTKMSYGGLLDPQDRLDLIAYLMTLK